MKRYFIDNKEVSAEVARETEKRNKEITSKPLSLEWLEVKFIIVIDENGNVCGMN